MMFRVAGVEGIGLRNQETAGETRRGFVKVGVMAAGGLLAEQAVRASGPLLPSLARLKPPAAPMIAGIRPALLDRARAALAQHGRAIRHHDLIAIADYDRPSFLPRFHLVDLVAGRAKSFLVAHGRGSDPAHSGWLQYFSNANGSLASSRGAYLTGERYTGKYGLSLRLHGLDYDNSNAMERAIVVHGASYVGEHMIREHGKVGRSEGCFAVPESELYAVLARLPAGHMIYSDKA